MPKIFNFNTGDKKSWKALKSNVLWYVNVRGYIIKIIFAHDFQSCIKLVWFRWMAECDLHADDCRSPRPAFPHKIGQKWDQEKILSRQINTFSLPVLK